jgi:hypothetical protein
MDTPAATTPRQVKIMNPEEYDLLTEKEQREGRTERILPGNLVRLRRIDRNVNVALAAVLTENDQLRGRLLLQENLGDLLEARLKKVLEPYLGD